ncbi:MAG: response regulator [Candidatus Ozemobacteraceae bacterium]
MSDKMKILIVDDKRENLVALREILREVDAEVIEASSGNQALAETLAYDFALAILDVQMPGMDGYELAELLRGDPKTAHVPVIFMTAAYGEEKNVFKGYNSGAVDYIVKPYHSDVLLAKVRVFLDLHRGQRELAQRVLDLAASEERFRALVATVPDIVYRIDVEGRFTFLNDAIKALGYSPEELIGKGFAEIIHPEDVERVSRRFVLPKLAGNCTGAEKAPKLFDERRRGDRKTHGLELRLISKGAKETIHAELLNLTNLIAEVSSSGLYVGGEDQSLKFLGTVGVIRDITQRKEYEMELTRYQQRLEAMVEERTFELGKRVKELKCLYDISRLEADANNPLEKVLQTAVELLPTGFQYSDAACARITFEGRTFTTTNFRETPWRLFVEIPVSGLEFEIFYLEENSEQDEGSFFKEERQMTNQIARKLGKMVERKRVEAEKEKLQDQLAQAQKMESVGRLAGGVAHDFNNMLGVMSGHAELALGLVDPTQPIYFHLSEISKATKRSADLTHQLLAFARKQTIAPRILNLNGTVAGMFNMLRRLIGEDVDLVWVPGAELWSVIMDPSQIDQILANLCVNARDAIACVGKVTIETKNVVIDEIYSAEHPGFNPGEYVLLAVSDDGCGIDKQILGKVFEPFFTTKELGKGTGLGLATVYGIVQQNNGFIDVCSEPGKGTAFRIYLPRNTAETERILNEETAKPALRGNETILLVEDQSELLGICTQMLTKQGFEILAASSPDEALRLAEKIRDRISLIVTDVVMPQMNGRELANRLQSFCPDAKCLYMSGYTADVIAQHGVLETGIHFLQKPFSLHDMAAKIRKVLDGK